LAFEAPEEVRILRGHTRCPGAIPFLQVVRCERIHVLARNKPYRVTYLGPNVLDLQRQAAAIL
jgi:hypothetical protein